MHAFFSGSTTSGKKFASIVLFMISKRGCRTACLTCKLSKKPRTQKSEDHAELEGHVFSHLFSFIFLSCDQDFRRIFFLAEGAAQLRQRNVLQLANSLARHPEILAYVFQRLRLSTVETETLSDDFFLAFVEHLKKPVHLMEQILVAQQFEWCFRVLVANHLAKLRRVIVPDCGVERSRADTETF